MRRSNCSGAILLEFSLTASLIIGMLVSVLEFGRLFSQMSWAIQTSYNTTRYGGDLPIAGNMVPSTVAQRGDLLSQISNRYMINQGQPNGINVTPSYDDITDTVRTTLSANLNFFFASWPLHMSVEVIGPHLMGSANLANADQFAD